MSKYDSLNKEQREAVYHTEGPLLLLAGAGSGKTRVLTHRIAYLIEEKKVRPYNIMAITFTNKAAKEMRERVDKLIQEGGQSVWVSTFHSSCVRILRRHIDSLDPSFSRYFTIYDTDDSKRLIRECVKELDYDKKQFTDRAVLSDISAAKNECITPAMYEKDSYGDFRKNRVASIYRLYQEKLEKSNSLDFGDLIFKTVQLFEARPDILEEYQNLFHYIMVDEYQDTNTVQFRLVSMLAKKRKNICVVGDDDQSIYKFRGADIKNILNFELVFSGAKVIRLEQNYRSSKNILAAANQVIKNNSVRKVKKLWTDNETGSLVNFSRHQSEKQEGAFISSSLNRIKNEKNADYRDMAILYRTNMQSRVLEENLIRDKVPYKILAGVSFYQRKEIKDILAYLRIISNPSDDLSVKRIINVPRRGIGNTTIERIAQHGYDDGITFFESAADVANVPTLKNAKSKVLTFVNMIKDFQHQASTNSLVDLMENILLYSGYKKELELENTTEAKDRLDNIGELISKMAEYEANTEAPTLNGFLEEVSLIADIDSYTEDDDYVVLMTLHSAKGLEFPYVFMAGLEDGLFPSYMSINSGNEEDIEEERRLCYVGITRAKEELYITAADSRMLRGQTMYSKPSRFIEEIPEELLEIEENNTLTNKGSNLFANSDNRFAYKNRMRQQNGYKNPYTTKTSSIPKPKNVELTYGVGDFVKHGKYGLGVVEKIEGAGADFQVTVNFPSHGVKKLLASFAKLIKS